MWTRTFSPTRNRGRKLGLARQTRTMVNASLCNSLYLFLSFLCHPYILSIIISIYLIYIYKEGLSRTVVREVLPRATTHRHQTFPDYGRHAPAEECVAKTSKRPSAILDLRRKYTVFRARSYAANTKEEPQPLFANSSRECRPIMTKRSQPWHAVSHINIRW